MANLKDRLVSCVSYLTYGIFGIIYLVYANFTKENITPFVRYNIFQSFFISVILALIAYVFNIIIKIFAAFVFLDNIIQTLNLFINHNFIYFGFSISGLIVTVLILYTAILSLLGKRPFVPVVSPAIDSIVRG